ncbi:hypothetical protein D3C80_2145730 [compost metagenome]
MSGLDLTVIFQYALELRLLILMFVLVEVHVSTQILVNVGSVEQVQNANLMCASPETKLIQWFVVAMAIVIL